MGIKLPHNMNQSEYNGYCAWSLYCVPMGKTHSKTGFSLAREHKYGDAQSVRRLHQRLDSAAIDKAPLIIRRKFEGGVNNIETWGTTSYTIVLE